MSKQAEFAVILKMNPMFADLGVDELQRISNLCHTQHLGLGEVLFQKGDAGDFQCSHVDVPTRAKRQRVRLGVIRPELTF